MVRLDVFIFTIGASQRLAWFYAMVQSAMERLPSINKFTRDLYTDRLYLIGFKPATTQLGQFCTIKEEALRTSLWCNKGEGAMVFFHIHIHYIYTILESRYNTFNVKIYVLEPTILNPTQFKVSPILLSISSETLIELQSCSKINRLLTKSCIPTQSNKPKSVLYLIEITDPIP